MVRPVIDLTNQEITAFLQSVLGKIDLIENIIRVVDSDEISCKITTTWFALPNDSHPEPVIHPVDYVLLSADSAQSDAFGDGIEDVQKIWQAFLAAQGCRCRRCTALGGDNTTVKEKTHGM